MFHAQNQYMAKPTLYPTNGWEMPPSAGEWTGEIGEIDPMNSAAHLQMQNNLPPEVIEAPLSADEAYKGSLKALLRKNLGNFIVATFLVGTQGTTTWEGILYDVGNDYLAIYQESRDRYIVSDIYSLKFIEFYDIERQQLCRTMLEEQGLRNPAPRN